MKKYIALILVLAIGVGVFAYSFSYKNKKIEANKSNIQIDENIETNDSEFTSADLIGKSSDGQYEVFYKNGIALITHNEARLEISKWSSLVEKIAPELYYNDFDNDGENELLISAVDEASDTFGEKVYSNRLYMIKPYLNSENKEELKCFIANAQTWGKVFSKAINYEVTQPDFCKKYIQFVMSDIGVPIAYDDNGLSTGKHTYYFKADCDEKRNYYTVSGYSRGLGIYSIDKNGKISLDIQVIIKYDEDANEHLVGNIHSSVIFNNSAFGIEPMTTTINVIDEYKISDPREIPQGFSYSINNIGKSTGKNKTISTIECNLDISKNNSRDINFDTYHSDITNVDKIDISENSITISAKDGYTFDKSIVDDAKFSVFIDKEQKSDVSYKAEIKDNKLIITLEKGFEQSSLTDFTIKIGK